MLLAPKLHTFIWDFQFGSDSWPDFAQPQCDWILDFAKQSLAKLSALRTIENRFSLEEPSMPKIWEHDKEAGYPWDRLEELRCKMQLLRISLKHFPQPIITKSLSRRSSVVSTKYEEEQLEHMRQAPTRQRSLHDNIRR